MAAHSEGLMVLQESGLRCALATTDKRCCDATGKISDCSRFVAERVARLAYDGAPAVTANNLVEQLLHSPSRWKTINEPAHRIMTVRQRRWQLDQAPRFATPCTTPRASSCLSRSVPVGIS
uniref:Uncharacterized protein n=1 Tax=Anopheles atroparvus TaxID=41427 RepID=A0A182J5P9_ANOAO